MLAVNFSGGAKGWLRDGPPRLNPRVRTNCSWSGGEVMVKSWWMSWHWGHTVQRFLPSAMEIAHRMSKLHKSRVTK